MPSGGQNLSHGHNRKGKRSLTYTAWVNMKIRCTKPSFRQYADYGGRGITYTPRWETFANFLEDMGEKPAGLTLDRIDNELGYSKENCRWATWSQQAYNRRPKRKE